MMEKIIWDDAGAFDTGDEEEVWFKPDEIIDMYAHASFIASSVGFVIYEDDDSIILCQSSEKHFGQYARPFRIPKKMIVERITLGETE